MLLASSTDDRNRPRRGGGRCSSSGPPRVSPASSTNDRVETTVSVGASPPPDQRDRPVRRRRRRYRDGRLGEGGVAGARTGPWSSSSSPARRASRSPGPSTTTSPTSDTHPTRRPGHVDRVGLLCGGVIGLAVVALVILGLADAPTEACVAVGGIGTTLAVPLGAYLRRAN